MKSLLTAILVVPTLAAASDDLATIQPLVQACCVQCHGHEKQKGDLRLDRLAELDTAMFESVYEQLADGSMPPHDQRQPTAGEREEFMQHLLELAKRDAVVTASGMRRLNKREYRNTVRDLLGLNNGIFDPGEYIYDDDVDDGFDTSADSLVISNELLMEYMEAADKSLRHALFTAAISPPVSRSLDVNIGRMRGVGGRRYINNGEEYIICRCGGKAMLYDGQPTRTMRLPGNYKITVTAAGVDRDSYPIRFAPVKGPVVLGFGVKQDGAASVSSEGKLLKKFELKDDVEQTFQFNVWIDKGYFPYFSFVNGADKPITQVRSNVRRRKLDRSELSKPYRGPGIRISGFRVEGPSWDEWPPESIRTTYDADGIPNLADSAVREEVVLRFANRAFRRNVTKEEVAPYIAFLDRQLTSNATWHEATIRTFSAMMSSVDFLYIREDQGELNPYELASRLSYFFWSTMPDSELFRHAESAAIKDPLVLRRQVSRMLSDPRSERFSTSFAEQWLTLDKLGTMPPDTRGEFRIYYKDRLQSAMLEETHRFFRYVLHENRSVRDFLDSDYSFVNKKLADLYQVPFKAEDGKEFQRVTFPPNAHRGGLLGHGSILTLSANGVETSPIERGVWVLAELLGTPPPPPPKEVPALTPDLNGAETVRDLLEKHRADKACMECHRRMDPLGFALEAYDPIGRFRTRYSKTQSVNTEGNYLGHDFADVDGLKQILVRNVRPFARGMIVRIAEYAKGRKLGAADYPTVEAILAAVEKEDFKLKDIVYEIAVSDLMAHR